MDNYDFFEPIPSRINATKDPENRRMEKISHEIHRRCQLYEEELRKSQENVNLFEIEQRVAELYAKEKGLWIPFDNILDLGEPGPSGNENDTYVTNNIIYKVNNLLNAGGIEKLFDKIILHNHLFLETAYQFHGFAGYDNRSIYPVFSQNLISESTPATIIEIEMYMAALGFQKTDVTGRFISDEIEIWDVLPRNVLKDMQGDLFVVDAELRRRR
ncbi:MAG: hypothetical protein SOW01_08670 [Mediterranea sp.]|nr:hypothetical protein [Mediterranea sp.]